MSLMLCIVKETVLNRLVAADFLVQNLVISIKGSNLNMTTDS